MTRLYDAVPEIDFVWATITPGDVDCARRQPGDGAHHVRELPQAPAGRGAPSGPGAGDDRAARDDRRRLAPRTAHMVRDELHHRAAAARRRDDRGPRPHGAGRLSHLRAAHAADGHHRADERARHEHPEHGGAAQRGGAVPARRARLRDGLRRGLRGGGDAHRPVSLGRARGRPHQHDLHRDEPVLRPPQPGQRRELRRQGLQSAGRCRGHAHRAWRARWPGPTSCWRSA